MTSSVSVPLRHYVSILTVLALGALPAAAHPGSGIGVDAQRRVYFVDTGEGIWRLDPDGKPTLIDRQAYHWMALDGKGAFARSRALGNWDRGSVERITPPDAVPALILSSDYPIAVGRDGGIYYVPYSKTGPRELVRRMPDGDRSVFATLPKGTGPDPRRWVNGITAAADGALFVTDDEGIHRIGRDGTVSTSRDEIRAPDCSDPLPDVPKLPYLRGLAVGEDGTIYTAANGCRAVLAVPREGPIRTILKAESPWSPTDVAIAGGAVYVLEYRHTPGHDRMAWTPRVRKVDTDGGISTLTTIERRTE